MNSFVKKLISHEGTKTLRNQFLNKPQCGGIVIEKVNPAKTPNSKGVKLLNY